MFRLFSQIRKNLITKNRFRTYFFYALGEIVLVVIGILIALQIDSWNEAAGLRKKEVVYLKEIRVNLEDDLKTVRFSIDFDRKKDSVLSVCLNALLSSKSNLEAVTVIRTNMPVLAEFAVFTQNRVAFDNMLSAENIDLISTAGLRTSLSTYYAEKNLLEGTQERVKELTRKFVDNTTPLLMTRENLLVFLKTETDFISGNEINVRTNRGLFGDLFGMQKNVASHIVYLEDYQDQIQKNIQLIDQFLSQKN